MATKYLTETEVRARWGADRVDRLIDRDRDGMPDAGMLTEVIERAERHADEVLSSRYDADDLPTTPGTTSDSLKDITQGVVWYYLHEHLDSIADSVIAIRDEAFRRLARVAGSRASLGLSTDPTIDRSTAQILVTKGVASRVLDADALEDW